MFKAEMIAPCGLDCSICSRALVEADPCPGCSGPDEHKPEFCAKRCGIILCQKRRENGYRYCDECPDYPCEDVMEKENRYTTQYPHRESPLENLRMIRNDGMDAFLEYERQHWTCPHCGRPFSVHDSNCPHCGKKIRPGEAQPDTDAPRIPSKDSGVSTDTLPDPFGKPVCQCCGMPLTEEDMISREPDGSLNEDYCKWCYADGKFTYKTKDSLIDFLLVHMPDPGDLTEEERREQCSAYLSQLKHWK